MSRRTGRRRQWAREEIARLDPARDYERIAHLSAEVRYGDPPLAAVLYTVAFCRQMAVPSIAAVVHRGGRGPIVRSTRRRNDDTMRFFGEFLRHGPSSPTGGAWIDRMNAIHARFPITDEQSRYTLASLTFEAVRIPHLLGADPLTAGEAEALFRFWRAVGVRMGLAELPDSAAAFWAWTQEYERREWAWTSGGEAVARALLDDLAARWGPARARPAVRALCRAAMGDPLLDALHLERPSRATRATARVVARGYFAARRVLPDPPERSWADSFGRQHGATPRPAEVGHDEPLPEGARGRRR